MTNTNFKTQEGSTQNTNFLNGKTHTPPETKANKDKLQTQPKTPTPPKVEHKVNNQQTHHAKRSKQTSLTQEARCKIKQL
jgi:hypothetical protein